MTTTEKDPTVADLGVEEIRESQFPSIHDAEGVEIAERSTDVTASRVSKYRKDFVLLKREYVGGDKSAIHAANRDAVRQFLVNLGLRSLPDEKIAVSTEDHRDGKSITLSYTVTVTPAVVATDPTLAHTRVDGGDPFEGQAAAEDETEDETDELDPQAPGTPAS